MTTPAHGQTYNCSLQHTTNKSKPFEMYAFLNGGKHRLEARVCTRGWEGLRWANQASSTLTVSDRLCKPEAWLHSEPLKLTEAAYRQQASVWGL